MNILIIEVSGFVGLYLIVGLFKLRNNFLPINSWIKKIFNWVVKYKKFN